MEAGQFQIRVTVDSVLGEGSPPSLKTATFSLCPHMTEPLTPSQGSTLIKGFPDFSVVKNPPANGGDVKDMGVIPGQEDPLGEGTETHSSILAWRIPGTGEPGGLPSMGSHRVRHD